MLNILFNYHRMRKLLDHSYYTFYYFINSSSRTFFFLNKYRQNLYFPIWQYEKNFHPKNAISEMTLAPP